MAKSGNKQQKTAKTARHSKKLGEKSKKRNGKKRQGIKRNGTKLQKL